MSKINETNYPRRTQANYEDTDMLVIQKAGGNTYTTRIEDLREDCQETLAPALDTMRENLATIEGSTASKAYAKGDFLVFGGRLCKAKTSIASGATLVLDTNIELDSVGDELSSLSSDLTVHTINQNSSYTNVNQTINAGSSYTAPADGLYSIELAGSDGSTGAIYLDSNRTKPLVLNKSSDLIGVLLPLKQGAIIYTRNTYGSYYVNGYAH
jgi:hypothetical protein